MEVDFFKLSDDVSYLQALAVICTSFTKQKRACSAIPHSLLEIKFNLSAVAFY